MPFYIPAYQQFYNEPLTGNGTRALARAGQLQIGATRAGYPASGWGQMEMDDCATPWLLLRQSQQRRARVGLAENTTVQYLPPQKVSV